MSCIKTHTGIMFDPLNPKQEEILIEDISHALPMLCRANGHFTIFYSVGLHSINCMKEAEARGYSQRVQLACLLHDGSEAYLSDVTRPVKKELPQYVLIEEPLQAAIWQKFMGAPLTREEYRQVFEIDDHILYHEFLAMMEGTRLHDNEPVLYSKPVFEFVDFAECTRQFLEHFHRLQAAI